MANEFKSNVGSKVTKKVAEDWIARYDAVMRKDKKVDTKSIFYGRDALLKMLSTDDSTGLTICLALSPNDEGKEVVNLVLVPTKEDGTKIWDETEAEARTMSVASTAYDGGSKCPPYCS